MSKLPPLRPARVLLRVAGEGQQEGQEGCDIGPEHSGSGWVGTSGEESSVFYEGASRGQSCPMASVPTCRHQIPLSDQGYVSSPGTEFAER